MHRISPMSKLESLYLCRSWPPLLQLPLLPTCIIPLSHGNHKAILKTTSPVNRRLQNATFVSLPSLLHVASLSNSLSQLENLWNVTQREQTCLPWLNPSHTIYTHCISEKKALPNIQNDLVAMSGQTLVSVGVILHILQSSYNLPQFNKSY